MRLRNRNWTIGFVVGIMTGFAGAVANANEVAVEAVSFVAQPAGAWSVHVTLRHSDAGWEHYADAWRVVNGDGKTLGVRTLLHPHEAEQPFTRSLSGIKITPTTKVVFVEAHDKVHGWSQDRVQVDLSRPNGPRFTVQR